MTVTPSSASVIKGQTIQLVAVVETNNFAPKSVKWSVSEGADATVDIYGKVTIGNEASGEIVVTATSTFDKTKTATATLTVSA